MKLVVKVGGKVLEQAALRRRLVRQMVRLSRAGHALVVVHGGGSTLTAMLKKLGIATRFISGLRYTDTATRDVALMVLAGLVNKRLVADFMSMGGCAVGLCGGDAGLARTRKLRLRSNGRPRDLGWVGRPDRVNSRFLGKLIRDGAVPVVASLGLGARGQYYNVNADDLAAALAVSMKADRLIYVSDTDGVWDRKRRRLPVIRVKDIGGLVRQKVVTGGMVPKLLSCARTLKRNVSEILILGAQKSDVLWRSIVGKEKLGTRIVRKP